MRLQTANEWLVACLQSFNRWRLLAISASFQCGQFNLGHRCSRWTRMPLKSTFCKPRHRHSAINDARPTKTIAARTITTKKIRCSVTDDPQISTLDAKKNLSVPGQMRQPSNWWTLLFLQRLAYGRILANPAIVGVYSTIKSKNRTKFWLVGGTKVGRSGTYKLALLQASSLTTALQLWRQRVIRV